MSFGKNLLFLRKMHGDMTQEKLAEKMKVSRQTISKWEMDGAFPEMEKAIQLCGIFNCSLDELLRGDINLDNPAYSEIRITTVKAFQYVKYTVISDAPEDDAKNHMALWAKKNHILSPDIIGWDFPFLSKEQINVYHMHGYTTACILPENFTCENVSVDCQKEHRYVKITIEDPFTNPFVLIPNAYQTLMRYIEVNQLGGRDVKEVLSCFEKEYRHNGTDYMDIYLVID